MVEEKTRELKQAHQRMLHVEKMATIGKMAAVVAHEINNPLSGNIDLFAAGETVDPEERDRYSKARRNGGLARHHRL